MAPGTSGAVAPICRWKCRMYNNGQSAQDLLDLDEIMRAFGVEHWTNLGPPRYPSGDLFQVLVEVQGQMYLLRERPEGPVEQEIGHVYAFQRYLAGQGIPVTPFYLTPEGELFDSGDRREKSWIAAAGEMLGRLHRASLHYPGPQYRWPSEVQAGGLTQGWLNFARSRAEQCEVYAIAAALSTMVESWEAALPAAMMAIGTGRNLPEFHIHGDYSALNLRFSSQGIRQVLGLDASRWEKRLLEVAYGVFYFAGLEWHGASGLTRPLVKRGLDPERAALFLRSYSAIYPPAPGEAALLVDALTLIAPIITANGPLEDLFYEAENAEEMLVEDVLERLAWATALPGWLARVRRSFAEMWPDH